MGTAASLVLGGLLAATGDPCGPVTACEVYEAFTRLASRELWPGFRPAGTPVAIYDGERTWLFGHPAPPEEFVAGGECGGCPVHDGQHADVRANTSATIGDVAVGTLLMDGSGRKTADEQAAVIVHETFHVFQDARYPGWTADEGALVVYPMTDAAALTARRMETEALRRGLEAAAPAERIAWIRLGLDVRRRRFADLPDEAVKYERALELREGLARYVQYKALERLGETALPADGFAADAVRGRCYQIGQAFAVLLDRLDPGWPARLDAEAAWLDAVLAAAIDAAPGPAATIAPQQRQALAIQAQRDVEALAAERRRAREQFLEQPGWSVRVLVTGEPLWPWGFDPMNLAVLDDGSLLHTRWFKLGNNGGRIEVLDREGLTIGAGDHPIFNGVREVIVTGIPDEPELFPGDKELYLGADGVSLHFENATAEQHGQEIAVTVR